MAMVAVVLLTTAAAVVMYIQLQPVADATAVQSQFKALRCKLLQPMLLQLMLLQLNKATVVSKFLQTLAPTESKPQWLIQTLSSFATLDIATS